MQQILKAEVKCQKREDSGKIEITRKELKKYGNKRVIIKVYLK
jgi:hypothetical protein